MFLSLGEIGPGNNLSLLASKTGDPLPVWGALELPNIPLNTFSHRLHLIATVRE